MSVLQVYLRVIALLGPEKWLANLLAAANLGLAGILLVEPWLFGRVIDSLVAQSRAEAWRYIGLWAGFGLLGIAAGVWVSLQSDSLFIIWLGFLRDHLATLLSILVMLPLALSINWKLALLMTGLMASFALFNALAMRLTDRAQTKVERLHQEIAARTGDVLSNAQVVQSYTRHEAEVADIRALTDRVLAAQYPVLRGWAWLSVGTRAASTLTVVAIFLLGVSLNGKGEVTVGNIVTFSGFAMTLIGRLEQFAGFISALFFQIPSLREFFVVLDTPSAPKESPDTPVMPPVSGEVVFENVSFAYGNAHPALHALSFRVPAGGRWHRHSNR